MVQHGKNSEFVTRGEWVAKVQRITGTTQGPIDRLDHSILRVKAAVVLAGALPGLNTGIAGNLMPRYADIDNLNDQQKDAVRYLYHTGIMFGYGDRTFKPDQQLAESEAAEILTRGQQRLQAQKPAVPYEVIDDADTLPPEAFAKAQPALGTPGVAVVQTDDAAYAIISASERPTGGYELAADSVVQGNGQIEILVQMQAPSSDLMVAQVITYPQLVLKFAPTTQPIIVINPESLQ